MVKLTYSAIKVMDECQRCFWYMMNYDWKRLDTFKSKLANRIDEKLKEDFDILRQQRKVPSILISENINLFPDQQIIDVWRDISKGLEVEDKEFNCKLKACPDDILQKGDKLIVLDFKTVSKKAENCNDENLDGDIELYNYKLQLELYSYVLQKAGYETEDYGYILFYFLKDFDSNGKSFFDKTLKKINLNIGNVKNVIDKALKIINQNEPPINGCKHCLPPEVQLKLWITNEDNLLATLKKMNETYIFKK